MMMATPISEPPSSKETLDALVSSTIRQLGVQESISAQQDVYGIFRQPPEHERNDEIQAMTQILEARLATMKQGAAYEVAEAMNSSYCTNQGFRLMFLRANKYDAYKAASQMIGFFELKLKLFGREKITKDITLDDLDKDDKKCLEQGSAQAVSIADRHIFMCFPGLRKFNKLENELRAWYYIIMSLLQFKNAQIYGIRVLNYAVGSLKDKTSGKGFVELTRLLLGLPVHIAAAHHCCDEVAQYILLSGAIRLGAASHLARLTVHYGSHVEVAYNLATYGIHQSSLPLSPSTHEVLLDNHHAWIRTRQVMDAVQIAPQRISMSPRSLLGSQGGFGANAQLMPPTKSDGVQVLQNTTGIRPHRDDVLFGQENKGHPGNVKMHQLMDHLQKQYEASDKQGKMKISLVVVFSMKGAGSRFLDFDDATNQWQVVPDTVARNKVAKAIRNRRRYKAKQEAKQEAMQEAMQESTKSCCL